MLFDHVEGACYLLCLGSEVPCDEVTTWLDTMSARLRSLPSASIPETRLEMVPPGDVPAQVELRHDKEAYLKRVAHCLRPLPASEQPGPYGALLCLGSLAVLSASPERFVTIDAQRMVESGPIKGTRPRGATPEADAWLREDLARHE